MKLALSTMREDGGEGIAYVGELLALGLDEVEVG